VRPRGPQWATGADRPQLGTLRLTEFHLARQTSEAGRRPLLQDWLCRTRTSSCPHSRGRSRPPGRCRPENARSGARVRIGWGRQSL